ncbi:MAG: Acyl carrier protein [Myxococcota bacterium]|nr:Acyl carrier protein [Myxococcota bacterium]
MQTDNPSIEATVHALIAELAGVDAASIRNQDHLMQDLGLDSLQSMELLSRLSETYGVDPDMDEVMAAATVDAVISLIRDILARNMAA